MKTNFDNVAQVIDALNTAGVLYLILRNYENLLDDNIYVGGHEDIDFLCADYAEIVEILGAISNRKKADGTHYHIFVNGNRVNLDLRSVGDGYYCEKWQKEMLLNRRLYKTFYVMSERDYYYSLIHHAILQKKVFTEEYHDRLKKMAENLGIFLCNHDSESFINNLQDYMLQNDYVFEYTIDPSIPLQYHLVNKSLIKSDKKRLRTRRVFLVKTNAKKLIVGLMYKVYKKMFR